MDCAPHPPTDHGEGAAMVTVQKQLSLRTGLAGDWTEDATQSLRTLLNKKKRGAPAPGPLAIQDREGANAPLPAPKKQKFAPRKQL